MSAASTTIYAKLFNNIVGWGATNLYTNTHVYWNTCIANNFSNAIPNYSNPIIFSNTYDAGTAGTSGPATIWVMCDNKCTFYFNNTLIGSNGGYPNGYSYNITLISGINTFVFYCVNGGKNINPAGFAINLYASGTSLPSSGQITGLPYMYTDSICSGGTYCSGWKCRIGGFFLKNQPLSTLFGATYLTANTLTTTCYTNNALNAFDSFDPGTSTNNSNYQISGTDIKNSLTPCIPVITSSSVSANSITINWYFPGVCYAYYLFKNSGNTPDVSIINPGIGGTGSTNIYDNDATILLTNATTSQKYVTADVGIANRISQVGNNTYTFTGLAYNTSYPIRVRCYYNTINTSGATNSVTSNNDNVESAVTTLITYPAAPNINSVSSITANSARINYSGGTQGSLVTVTYYIYISFTTVLNSSNYTSGLSTNPSVNGLTGSTTYYLFITAENSSGTTLGNEFSFTTLAAEKVASGGIVSTITGYRVHTFTAIGASTFIITSGITNVEVLVIAGGGAGGTDGRGGTASNYYTGSGGGAGGYYYTATYTIANGTHNVAVGNGGRAASLNGSNSSFSSITSGGGGGGGGGGNGGETGKNGIFVGVTVAGSGGGGGFNSYSNDSKNGGYGSTYGGAGGFAVADGGYGEVGGGGGGAGGNGVLSAGGAGRSNNITGTSTTYCVGGSHGGSGINPTEYGSGGSGNSLGVQGIVIVRYVYP